MKIEVVEAQPYHCGRMARQLRSEHLAAVKNLGADIHRELRARVDESSYKKALFIDGRLVALGGVTGSLASPYGYVWLAVTNEAQKNPKTVLRIIARHLGEIMETYREVATTIISQDDAGRRLAAFLGFHTADDGPGSAAFTKAGRAILNRHLQECRDIRHPVGEGYAIPLGFHID